MNNSLLIHDPTSEEVSPERSLSIRPKNLEGLTIGLLDISKQRGDIFLNYLEKNLEQVGVKVKRYVKPTFAKPAPSDLRYEIAKNCDAVIEALAD